MSYANLVGQVCADKNEFFCRMRDFICKRNGTYDYSTTGIGWTLHDESYATDEDNCAINDWYVIYSPGEGGKDDLYFKVTWINVYIKIEGYQSWDNSANAGSTNKYNAANNFTSVETGARSLWVYGDLDILVGINKVTSTNYRYATFGKLEPVWEEQIGTIATCSTTLTAGSDVSVVVDSAPANWEVGTPVFIRTTHNDAMGTVEIELAEIKTIVSNTITLDLTNSYTTGSCISDYVGYFCSGNASFGGYSYFLIGDDGNLSVALTPISIVPSADFDPGVYKDYFYLAEYLYQGVAGFLGRHPILMRVPNFVAGFTYEDVIEEGDGTEWRCFKIYSNIYIGLKEV